MKYAIPDCVISSIQYNKTNMIYLALLNRARDKLGATIELVDPRPEQSELSTTQLTAQASTANSVTATRNKIIFNHRQVFEFQMIVFLIGVPNSVECIKL